MKSRRMLLYAGEDFPLPAVAGQIRQAQFAVGLDAIAGKPDRRYHAGKETAMIELTEQQRQELSVPEPVAIDPETREVYVLVRREAYERLKALLGWTTSTPRKARVRQRSHGRGRRQRSAPGELPALRETGMKRGDVVIVPFPFQDRPGQRFARRWSSRATPRTGGSSTPSWR